MPNETPPSSSRKNPDSASMRTWNGRSGRPAGRIAALGGAPIAHNPVSRQRSDTSAPTGNATPVMSRGVRINASPINTQPDPDHCQRDHGLNRPPGNEVHC